jgi:hypothetical protein
VSFLVSGSSWKQLTQPHALLISPTVIERRAALTPTTCAAASWSTPPCFLACVEVVEEAGDEVRCGRIARFQRSQERFMNQQTRS